MKIKLFISLMLICNICFALTPELKLGKKIYKYRVMCTCGFDYGYTYTEFECPDGMISHSICDLCYIESILKAGRKVNPKTLSFIRQGMQEAISKRNEEVLNTVIKGDMSFIEIHERGFIRYEIIYGHRDIYGEYDVIHYKESYNEIMSEVFGKKVDIFTGINSSV